MRKTNSYRRKKNPYREVYALGQHISLSAHKARRVIDQIRGCSYEQTLMILELMPYRVCYPILKLVYSAAANASHNWDFKKKSLVISKAEVSKGTTVKKLKPRARGRSYPIKRTACHIRIVLKDTSWYEYDANKEYLLCLKKMNEKKKKHEDMTDYSMYNSGGLWDKK
uniref:Large ribosomal subunit protein uL22c n=1 Tax=Sarcopyramis napalensis TaxID=2136672 RepID=A0A5P8GK37_9MYRT|nr:ribosomal protein L22 [Sarcopyramis napalensis]QFQ45234.1 ribosomal protein L22 [Sarcopyramis napalensis]